MKKYIKKTLSILLVATNFTFLFTTLGTSNILTYANIKVESKTEQKKTVEETAVDTNTKQDPEKIAVKDDTERDATEAAVEDDTQQGPEKITTESDAKERQDIEIVTSEFFPSKKFVHYIGTPFYFDENLEEAYTQSKDDLDKKYQDAKEKIQATLGLSYPDDLEIPIYVLGLIDKNFCGQYDYNSKYIEIDPTRLHNNQTLPHEMTHALVSYILEERIENFNLGINEGLATQNDDWIALDKLPEEYECFVDYYPTVKEERRIYYALHQYIIHDWIEAEGKDVVKKYLEDVKAGKDSVQAFLDLGGNKILEKYKYTVKKPKPPKKARKIHVE